MAEYRINGKPGTRSDFDAVAKRIRARRRKLGLDNGLAMNGARPAAWPMWSEAAGVMPEQIREQQEYDATLGFQSEFDPRTGAVKFEGRAHRKRYCEAHGMFDRDGGYGDPRKRS